MDPVTIGLLGGAAFGGLKSILGAGQEKRDRLTKFVRDAYSPWSGMQGQQVKENNVLGNLLGGAASGASLGQNIQTAQLQGEVLDAAKGGPLRATAIRGAAAGMAQPTMPVYNTWGAISQPYAATQQNTMANAMGI